MPDLPGSNEIRIPPFAVTIIKTKEIINMPPFLIGRWNIQVSRAYQGLVWVGGPQVDAGYVGHLFCPIYNLSDKEVPLHRGEAFAVIDFEKTTRFHEGKSKSYPKLPEKILFEDYEPQTLKSGLVRHANEIQGFQAQIERVQTRVDNFVSVTFAVVAILFAALAVSPFGKASPAWQYISVFLLSGIAAFFAAWAWVRSNPKQQLFGYVTQVIIVIGLAIAFLLQVFWIRDQGKQMQDMRNQILDLRKAQSNPNGAATKTPAPPVMVVTPGAENPPLQRIKP